MTVRDDPSAAAIASVADDSFVVDTVTRELGEFLDDHADLLQSFHSDLGLLADAARAAVLQGGKRLRPTFAFWGWRSVHPPGTAGEAELLRAASSLELLQACALVHDDVMDSSDTRRGRPAAHIRFGMLHAEHSWPGPAETFGRAGAILLGDLLLSWSEEMFSAAVRGFSPALVAAAGRQFDLMRTEVVAGQFLDVLAQTRGEFDANEALRVIRFKTSKYTVQRPLLLGAGAAGAGEPLLSALSTYGHALGEAFQLRDDLLGVFGDPDRTGKPAGDDLREGKRTLLVALAAESGTPAERQLLERAVGNANLAADELPAVLDMLRSTGAEDRVERRIADRVTEALDTLAAADTMRPEARTALAELAQTAAHRAF